MLRDDLTLLKMAWLNHAFARYESLNDVAADAAFVLPLLQQEFIAESERANAGKEGEHFVHLPSQRASRDMPGQRPKQ